MEYKENKKYRLILNEGLTSIGVRREDFLSNNNGSDIFTLTNISGSIGMIVGFWVGLKYLVPATKVIKYNKELL